ncbi:MAG TPA: glutathione S-transferase family protein [Xanthobacteraceae bacterium]|nr:glutathione S-transferase family protein [Xanthobacteraceae bacterium]
MSLHLVIGNKNYSSWSFRPWLAMKVASINFDETVISLDAVDFKTRVMALGGSGRVPVLSDGDVRVWESLAILEYLAEKFPAAELWPEPPVARARARAIASEMHAGFVSLRRHLPMNVARPVKIRALDAGAAKDVARIDAIWSECRNKYGAGGPFLFGSFGAADAMFAPVVWRFHTYAVEVSSTALGYMRAMTALPAWNEWRDAARRETWVLAEDEVDWPQVLREEVLR